MGFSRQDSGRQGPRIAALRNRALSKASTDNDLMTGAKSRPQEGNGAGGIFPGEVRNGFLQEVAFGVRS